MNDDGFDRAVKETPVRRAKGEDEVCPCFDGNTKFSFIKLKTTLEDEYRRFR